MMWVPFVGVREEYPYFEDCRLHAIYRGHKPVLCSGTRPNCGHQNHNRRVMRARAGRAWRDFCRGYCSCPLIVVPTGIKRKWFSWHIRAREPRPYDWSSGIYDGISIAVVSRSFDHSLFTRLISLFVRLIVPTKSNGWWAVPTLLTPGSVA